MGILGRNGPVGESLSRVTILAIVAGAAWLVVSGEATQAATGCVNPGGTGGCYSSVQMAINTANPGDTVTIAPGIYTGSFTLNKAVSLLGADRTTTVLRADPAQRVLTITGGTIDSSVIISGLTFSGGNATGSGLNCLTAGCGGGIYVIGNAAPVIRDVIVVSNTASLAGGGICVADYYHSGSLTLINALVMGNASGYGGGFYQGSAVGNHRIVNSLFSRNRASSLGDGLYNARGNTVILQATFADLGDSVGRGIYVEAGAVGITNTILAGYGTGIENLHGALVEAHNLFYGIGTPISGTVNSGGGDLSGSNPEFVNPATDDYHLGPGSAAIDAGTNDGVITDIDGDPRPFGLRDDLGYDEATFTLDHYWLSVTPIGSGSVISAPAQATYLYGTQVTLTATPSPGWSFAGWSGDVSGMITQTTVVMFGDQTVSAKFFYLAYRVRLPIASRGP